MVIHNYNFNRLFVLFFFNYYYCIIFLYQYRINTFNLCILKKTSYAIIKFFIKAFFLGFRDIYQELKEEYQFIPIIPTCSQLKETISENHDENYLSVEEAARNRLVTKVSKYLLI